MFDNGRRGYVELPASYLGLKCNQCTSLDFEIIPPLLRRFRSTPLGGAGVARARWREHFAAGVRSDRHSCVKHQGIGQFKRFLIFVLTYYFHFPITPFFITDYIKYYVRDEKNTASLFFFNLPLSFFACSYLIVFNFCRFIWNNRIQKLRIKNYKSTISD